MAQQQQPTPPTGNLKVVYEVDDGYPVRIRTDGTRYYIQAKGFSTGRRMGTRDLQVALDSAHLFSAQLAVHFHQQQQNGGK